MSNCTIQGCTNKAVARGLCAMHYMRQRRHGDPEAAFKPGRPPKPHPEDPASAAVRRENAALREENAALKQRLAAVAAELASERRGAASPPKAAKAALPPDEARERTIKGLRTRIRNLEAAVAAMAAKANMPRATQNAIAKALHPDRKLSAAEREAEQDKALKLFNEWKSDKDRAARMAKG